MHLPFLLLPLLLAACASAAESRPTAGTPVPLEPGAWAVEQMPGGSVTFHDGNLVIRDVGGCTVWYRTRLSAPVAITFTATFPGGDRPTDRVSDLNCFWMANDSRNDRAPFAPGNARTGRFADYDSLLTYYVGYGGNENRTTRFRRYNGTSDRPLLPEHDLTQPQFLLQRGRVYRIRLVSRDGVAEYWRDGERIFAYADARPLQHGWFALRTVRSHLVIEDVRIEPLP